MNKSDYERYINEKVREAYKNGVSAGHSKGMAEERARMWKWYLPALSASGIFGLGMSYLISRDWVLVGVCIALAFETLWLMFVQATNDARRTHKAHDISMEAKR